MVHISLIEISINIQNPWILLSSANIAPIVFSFLSFSFFFFLDKVTLALCSLASNPRPLGLIFPGSGITGKWHCSLTFKYFLGDLYGLSYFLFHVTIFSCFSGETRKHKNLKWLSQSLTADEKLRCGGQNNFCLFHLRKQSSWKEEPLLISSKFWQHPRWWDCSRRKQLGCFSYVGEREAKGGAVSGRTAEWEGGSSCKIHVWGREMAL